MKEVKIENYDGQTMTAFVGQRVNMTETVAIGQIESLYKCRAAAEISKREIDALEAQLTTKRAEYETQAAELQDDTDALKGLIVALVKCYQQNGKEIPPIFQKLIKESETAK